MEFSAFSGLQRGQRFWDEVDWTAHRHCQPGRQPVDSHFKIGYHAVVKVILESCYLSPEQVAEACRICEAAGADYVKTSTGFGDGPATPETVEIMMKTVGKTMGVKASGGIRDYETAVGYLKQGCKRLGVGSTEAVLDGAPE